MRSETPPKAHQRLPGEHLQQRDEVVSISEVLVQVGDVSLGLQRRGGALSSPLFFHSIRAVLITAHKQSLSTTT